MAKRKKKQDKVVVNEGEQVQHNPFAAALSGLSAPVADLPAQSPDVGEAQQASSLPIVRTSVERKGRRGKTVTVVTGLEALSDAERDEVARRLRKALGTGVTAEEERLIVQGALEERIARWFAEERGD